MKNLKKVLALGLALVMILGMFTIASAAETKKVATDLTDFDQVTNKEAVSLMVDLGVIKGLPDGSYGPANTIDRASWAKMVYFIITNDEDASVYIPSDGNVFADVPNTHWAAGEIAYLKTLGIVAGDGVNFKPSDTITMVEAYKMMLTGIGYDASYEKYVNDANWAGKVMKDASRLGLTDKLSGLKQGDNLTRDNAARIVYNALGCQVVELNEKQIGNIGTMVDGYKYYDTLAYENFKIRKLIVHVDEVGKDGIASFAGSTGAKMIGVKAAATDIGRSVQIWANVTKDADGKYQYNSAKSTSAFPADVAATKVVTGGVDLAKAFDKDDKDNYCGLPGNTTVTGTGDSAVVSPAVSYIMDGVTMTKNDSELTTAASKSGNVVEFWDDDSDGDIDLVTVTTWDPKQVGDIKTRTNSDGETEVSVGNITGGYVLADYVSGYASVAKDDVVLVNKSTIGKTGDTATVYTIEKINDTAVGKVTDNSSDKEITVDGTKYKLSDKNASDPLKGISFDAWTDFSSEFTFYLGKDGKVCYAVITEEGIDTSKVAMILDTLFVTGGDLDVANNARVKLLFTDGTTENVTVTKVNGLKIVSDDIATQDFDSAKQVKMGTVHATARAIFYNYKIDKDGKYELTAMDEVIGDDGKNTSKWDENQVAETPASLTIAKTPEFAEGFSANNKTLFIVDKQDKDDNSTFSTYTGYANVPKMNEGAVEAVVAATEAGAKAAKYVFIQTTAFADDKPDGLVYLRDDGFSGNDDYKFINIVDAKGNQTTLRVATDVKVDETALSFANKDANPLTALVGKFYTIESVTDGTVDSLKTVAAEEKKVVVTTEFDIGSGVVSVGTGNDKTGYEVTDSTVLVWIDLKADSKDSTKAVYSSCGGFNDGDNLGSTAEYPSGLTATIVLNDKTADYIYVIRDGRPAAEQG